MDVRNRRRGCRYQSRRAQRELSLSANKIMIEIATRLMDTESELILKSRRVAPAKLLGSGFEFQFPDWTSAARDLTKDWCANE